MKEVEIGQALRRLLDERGLSQWDLARRANVKEEWVSAALGGSGTVPVAAVRRLAHALEVELMLTGPGGKRCGSGEVRRKNAPLSQGDLTWRSGGNFVIE